MAEGELSLRAAIKIDGQPLRRELEPAVERVVVDDHLHLPDTFAITLRDVEVRILQDAGIKIGSRIAIAATALGETQPEPLITGEVTALEAEYDASGARAVVRGYDPSHRLHRGRRTDTYADVKDSDIASRLARRAGLTIGKVDDSGPTHKHVSQVNLSDWEFLKSRAREIGFELSVLDGKFNFTRPRPSSEAPSEGDYTSRNPLQLVLSQDLLEFRPRITSSQQVKEVTVRSWDPIEKRAITGSARAATTSAELRATPQQLAGKFGDPSHVVVDRPIATQAGVNAAAAAIAEQIASAFAEAELVARGNPKFRAGTPVSISMVGDDFKGGYTLTHTRHIFDRHGYRTEGVVSGRQERSLLGLASLGGTNGSSSGSGAPIYGLVVAVVTANKDPQNLGRVKLKFPWLSDTYESDWARMAQIGAGPDSGAIFLPHVNDEVLVAFEFGDVRRPYVIGGLYNGKDKPKLGDGLFDNGKVNRRGFVSRAGHTVMLMDDNSNSGIALVTKDGKLKVELKHADGVIALSCKGKITLEADQGIEIKSKQAIAVEAQTNLELKGNAGVKIQSSGNVEIRGAMIRLN